MKTLKLLIKTSLFNKINNFLCFDIIKYIFNRRSNKVLISYIIKINNWWCLSTRKTDRGEEARQKCEVVHQRYKLQ